MSPLERLAASNHVLRCSVGVQRLAGAAGLHSLESVGCTYEHPVVLLHDFQELQLELEAVRLRLLRRSQIIDVLRSAYVRDVVMIKNELMRKTSMGDEVLVCSLRGLSDNTVRCVGKNSVSCGNPYTYLSTFFTIH